MSSYYPSFSYTAPNGKKYNSLKDKNLLVAYFESGDSGEMSTFLGMEPVYTDNTYGTRRIDYGAKYNDVAVIRISVLKASGGDFTVAEVRDFLRWTTGSRKTSYLDLMDGDIVRASFLGRITAVYQQKLDARTIGFVIEHTSVSPYAYSPIRYAECSFGQVLSITNDGILYKGNQNLSINGGVLTNGRNAIFNVENSGTLYIDNSTIMNIDNDTDDLSDYIYMDMKFTNTNSDHVVIKNQTLYEASGGMDGVTEISNMHNNETITLSSGQFITSSSGRTFGNNFNFTWPKLLPGENKFVVSGTGEGLVNFSYRTPIKIGDCAVDITVPNDCICGDISGAGKLDKSITWEDIIGKPNTIEGYNITDAYTITEVNNKINSVKIEIDRAELDSMLDNILE
jgi:hypothetical protein